MFEGWLTMLRGQRSRVSRVEMKTSDCEHEEKRAEADARNREREAEIERKLSQMEKMVGPIVRREQS